ncbi:hypothetical protein B0H15DRAFT_185203 [Mycena belliarum]|uniref:Uncharacterized protein n=1 Tax=Mycena belliarum TaxID=1033014 RepID=A0AAD6U8N7_9AGAR|nr:hypothetical protein B0H15DRAFT_185203 [Mycena belliae]
MTLHTADDMSIATAPGATSMGPYPDVDNLQDAHDKAAQVMSSLSTGTDSAISADDRKTLEDFYSDLEERRKLLGHTEESSSLVEDEVRDGPDDTDIAQAFAFTKFLSSLDPNNPGTQLLVEGNKRATAALGAIEKGQSFLENAPMTKILEFYERIKFREEHLTTSGGPVSVVNGRIYLSEVNSFTEMVKMLIVLDIDVEGNTASGLMRDTDKSV